ncbi:hypothetical protein IW261DRAFT_1427776 [Armillaria novae-zelandiae]|uniref:Uncharacterized protein n=1 Tax=Armillaria novae-zelandiae TaxID=153914 RepID=A0AA39T476_9AGAR|nr:hypothetical protein IW261DRAFT_1427776 [Armillaria novae-zelandiae]
MDVLTATARAAPDLSLIQDIRGNVRNGDPFVHPAHIPYHAILTDYDTSANQTMADRVLREARYSDTCLALLVRRLNSVLGVEKFELEIIKKCNKTCAACRCCFSVDGYIGHLDLFREGYHPRLAPLLFLAAFSPFHRVWISEIRLLLLGQSGTPGLEFHEMSLLSLRQDTFAVVDAVSIGDFLHIMRISMLARQYRLNTAYLINKLSLSKGELCSNAYVSIPRSSPRQLQNKANCVPTQYVSIPIQALTSYRTSELWSNADRIPLTLAAPPDVSA